MQLKEIRIASGKTQNEVASYLNIGRASYTNIENGKRSPDVQTLILLADYFSVSIDNIVGREAKDTNPIQNTASIALSNHELQLVSAYRTLSSQGQEYIRQQMNIATSFYPAGDTGITNVEEIAK